MATKRAKKKEVGFLEWLSGLDLVIKIVIGAATVIGLYFGYTQVQNTNTQTIGNGKPAMGNHDPNTVGNGKPAMGR